MPLSAGRFALWRQPQSGRIYTLPPVGTYLYTSGHNDVSQTLTGKTHQVFGAGSDHYIYGMAVRQLQNNIYIYGTRWDEINKTWETSADYLTEIGVGDNINTNALFSEAALYDGGDLPLDMTIRGLVNFDSNTADGKPWLPLFLDPTRTTGVGFTLGNAVYTPGIGVGTAGEPKDMAPVGSAYNGDPGYIFAGRGSNFRLYTVGPIGPNSVTEHFVADFGSGDQRISVDAAFPGWGVGSAFSYNGYRQRRHINAITFYGDGTWDAGNNIITTDVREGNITTVNHGASTYVVAYGRKSSDANLPLITQLHRVDFAQNSAPQGTVLNQLNWTGEDQINERESQVVRGFQPNTAYLFWINTQNSSLLEMRKLVVLNDVLTQDTSASETFDFSGISAGSTLRQIDFEPLQTQGRKYFTGVYKDAYGQINDVVIQLVGSQY